MKHATNLQNRYFDFIKNGTKRIELRLNDEKRAKIQLGEEISFAKNDGEKLTAKVVGLLQYDNFANLFRDFPIEILSDKSMTKNELRKTVEEFYLPEKQREFGVLGIRLELK